MNFKELFEEAVIISDRRKKVFNLLIERIKTDILPEFCNVAQNYDFKTVYFKSHQKIFNFQNPITVYADEDAPIFCFEIDVKNRLIANCNFDELYGFKSDYSNFVNFDQCEILRTGAIELVSLLYSRLKNYNDRFRKENEKAENI